MFTLSQALTQKILKGGSGGGGGAGKKQPSYEVYFVSGLLDNGQSKPENIV